MFPAVAFRSEQNFGVAFGVVDERIVGRIDKRFRLFVVNGARFAVVRIDFVNAEALMPAISLVIKEMLSIIAPADFRRAVEIDRGRIDLRRFLVVDIEGPQLIRSVFVTRQRIFSRPQHRSGTAAARGRFEMIFIVRLGRFNAKCDDRFRIGGPRWNAVQIFRRAVGGELHFRAIAAANDEVEIFHDRGRFAIGRFALLIKRRVVRQIRAIGNGFGRQLFKARRARLAPERGRLVGLRREFAAAGVLGNFIRIQIALPDGVAHFEADQFSRVVQLDQLERQMIGIIFFARRSGKRRGEFTLIEGGSPRSRFGVDDDKFLCAVAQIIAIPEPSVIVKPMGAIRSL